MLASTLASVNHAFYNPEIVDIIDGQGFTAAVALRVLVPFGHVNFLVIDVGVDPD